MPGTQHLTSSQRKSVEWLARRKGITCAKCGSANLTCLDTAWQYVANIGVELRCTNRAEHAGSTATVQPFQFSFDEARVMGINVR